MFNPYRISKNTPTCSRTIFSSAGSALAWNLAWWSARPGSSNGPRGLPLPPVCHGRQRERICFALAGERRVASLRDSGIWVGTFPGIAMPGFYVPCVRHWFAWACAISLRAGFSALFHGPANAWPIWNCRVHGFFAARDTIRDLGFKVGGWRPCRTLVFGWGMFPGIAMPGFHVPCLRHCFLTTFPVLTCGTGGGIRPRGWQCASAAGTEWDSPARKCREGKRKPRESR